MMEIENAERPYPRPLSGAKVRRLPSALVPARTALIGRYVTLEPLDASRHAGELFEASHGSEAALHIWDYLPWGVLGSPKRSTRTSCANRRRGTTRFTMPFARRWTGKHAARQAFSIFNRNKGSLK